MFQKNEKESAYLSFSPRYHDLNYNWPENKNTYFLKLDSRDLIFYPSKSYFCITALTVVKPLLCSKKIPIFCWHLSMWTYYETLIVSRINIKKNRRFFSGQQKYIHWYSNTVWDNFYEWIINLWREVKNTLTNSRQKKNVFYC